MSGTSIIAQIFAPLNHIEQSFQAVFCKKILAGITANFYSNNSDGRI